MPHYKDGTKAQLGDFAKADSDYRKNFRGQVVQIHESDSCNLTIARVQVALPAQVEDGKYVPIPHSFQALSVESATFTAKDCERIG